MEVNSRPVNTNDCAQIFNWRNELAVRQYATNANPIEWSHHQTWFNERINRVKAEPFLIFELNDLAIGMARLDLINRAEESFQVSILVNPSARKLGHGTIILISTLNLAFNSFYSKVVHAKVHVENKASVRLFQNVGFTEIKRAEHFINFEKRNQ